MNSCAEGWSVTEKSEYWWVSFRGQTYRSLPKGKHGARVNPEIEAGHVRSMVRFLGIDEDCVSGQINLGMKKKGSENESAPAPPAPATPPDSSNSGS